MSKKIPDAPSRPLALEVSPFRQWINAAELAGAPSPSALIVRRNTAPTQKIWSYLLV